MNQPKEFDPTVLKSIDTLTASESALKHIQKELKKRGHGIGIRLNLEKKGCTGFAYVVEFADEIKPSDVVFPLNDELSIFVTTQFLPFLKGTYIDYVREGMNSRFKFNNPNEKHGCGCGESFTFD